MKISLCLTTSKKLYNSHVKDNINMIRKHWPEQIDKHIWSEDNIGNITGFTVHDLFLEAPELKKFLDRHQNTEYKAPARHPKKGIKKYKENLLKWPYKVYAQWCCSKNVDSDYMIFLDTDIVTQKNLPIHMLTQYCFDDKFTSYLGRSQNIRHERELRHWCYSETGFIIYNLRHPHAVEFFDRFVDYWTSDRIITETPDCVDNTVFDILREKMEQEGKIINYVIGDNQASNPLKKIELGRYLKHYMGENYFQKTVD